MKRLLPSLPIIFLILLDACSVGGDPKVPSIMSTLVIQTVTAAAWTPMPTQTDNPYIPIMVNWLNTDLSSAHSLEWSLDAEYRVINVSFPNVPESGALVFRVDVQCACINGDECCFPERTFVVLTDSMKRNVNALQIPIEVSEIMVVCYKNKTKTAAISAPWQDVKSYLQGQLTGYQLAPRVVRTALP